MDFADALQLRMHVKAKLPVPTDVAKASPVEFVALLLQERYSTTSYV